MSREAVLESAVPEILTLEQWSELSEDVNGELVDGYLEEEEVPGFVHEFLVALLCRIFAGWIVPRGGLVGGSDAKFAIGKSRGRKPDLTVYLPGSPRPPRYGLIHQPPDVAVEIISPRPRDTRRDRVDKLADYAGFGIRYYWLVDPELRSVEILELGPDGRYIHALGASAGKIDPVPGCEGLVLDLDELWRDADLLATDETSESSE